MKVIYNNIIPFRGFTAINLFGFIFARKEYEPLAKRTLNHEAIHTEQMKEMLYVFFYLWYVIEWLVRLVQYRNARMAYRNISFEREAYMNQGNMGYLQGRGRYAWWKYLKGGSE